MVVLKQPQAFRMHPLCITLLLFLTEQRKVLETVLKYKCEKDIVILFFTIPESIL